MSTIKNLRKRVQNFQVQEVAVKSLDQTKEAIADLNVQQMISGKRADGSEILPTYKDITIAIKKSKGQPTDRVTLRDTGLFQEKITTTVTANKVITDSSDDKSEKLQKKYGRIFGLSENFKSEYLRENLNPAFLRNCKIELRL
jgi:hypothetical protein